MAGQLHGQVAGKAAGGLDQHNRHVVCGAIGEQGDEAGPRIDGIGPRHRRVIELCRHRQLGGLGIGGHGVPLTPLAVLIGAHIGGGTGAVVGDGSQFS